MRFLVENDFEDNVTLKIKTAVDYLPVVEGLLDELKSWFRTLDFYDIIEYDPDNNYCISFYVTGDAYSARKMCNEYGFNYSESIVEKPMKEDFDSNSVVNALGMQVGEIITWEDYEEAEYAIETAYEDGDINEEDYKALLSDLRDMEPTEDDDNDYFESLEKRIDEALGLRK